MPPRCPRRPAPVATCLTFAAGLLTAAACRPAPPPAAGRDWAVTGGEPGNSRYSALAEIDRRTVRELRVAWTYHTGDAAPGGPGSAGSQIQATPVVVDGVLYATSPGLRVFALRADTGTELWRFDPGMPAAEVHANRGVAYWAAGDGPAAERRVFVTAGRHLYALDARTGRTLGRC